MAQHGSDLDAVVAEFIPELVSIERFGRVESLVRDAVARCAPDTPARARDLLRYATYLAGWCDSEYLPLRLDVLFHPKTIEEFVGQLDKVVPSRALKEEYARRSRFIMGVSHDLRTPLTLIQGYVEAISDGFAAEPESQKKYLSIILDKTHALEAMIGELIEFVKMETGEWRMTHRDVPVRSFLVDNARRFAEDAQILKREFSWSVEVPETWCVRMDAGLFSRALGNLVGNAIRYTEENGTITMKVVAGIGEVVLSIMDTGIGIIPKDEVGRIFDPFYRGTNSRREQGFGLGLTTVRSIIESHGWNISVHSAVGEGTTFTIRMPVAAGIPA